MLPSERLQAIAAEVAVRPSVRTDELASTFGVSGETIRRDLLKLQRDGVVERVYGGATSTDRPRAFEPDFANRERLNATAKRAMGAAAAGLVSPGDTIVLDVGTSALQVALALPASYSGTVLTNSLRVAMALAGRPGVDVLVSGGRVRAGDNACANDHAVSFFNEYYSDVAFLGSGGLDAEAGLTDYHDDEVTTRRVILGHAAASFALADSSKFGVVALRGVCDLDRLTGVVCESSPDGPLAQALHEAGVAVHVAPPDKAARSG